MTMIRHPAVYTAPPSRSLVPAAGSGIWYPLHGDFTAGIEDLEPLVETGTPSGSVWGTPLVWTAETNNTANGSLATDDEDNLYNDAQLSYVGAAVGNQFVYAMRASYSAATGGNSFLFGYGRDSATYTLTGLYVSSSDVPGFYHRAKGQSVSGATSALGGDTGTFVSLRGQGIFELVLSVHVKQVSADLTVSGATALVDLVLHASNGTQSCIYSASDVDILQWANDGRELPGISGGVTAANMGGLSIGGRLNASAVMGNGWGRGAGNVGPVGGLAVRKFTTHDADRVPATLASMLARPGEFPRTLCLD